MCFSSRGGILVAIGPVSAVQRIVSRHERQARKAEHGKTRKHDLRQLGHARAHAGRIIAVSAAEGQPIRQRDRRQCAAHGRHGPHQNRRDTHLRLGNRIHRPFRLGRPHRRGAVTACVQCWIMNAGCDGQRGLGPHRAARFKPVAERGLRHTLARRIGARIRAVQDGTAKGFGKYGNGLAPICHVRLKHDPI